MCATLGKVLERMTKEQLSRTIASKRPLSRKQHGFRTGRSTLTNLIETDSIVAEWENLRQPYDVITLIYINL